MNYNVTTRSLNGNRILFRNLILVMGLLLSTSIFSQDINTTKKGVFEFESTVVDYGTIAQNADGVRAFKFKNTGNSPIIITAVKGSCGCTVPTKPDGPILPGESAEIGVKYATNRVGAFSKTVTVTSNASESTLILKIKGNVLAPETGN